ncbi:hypothetical protein AK830_g230 [Neonectria ditissima]|uniref:Uncharacterized protein n=1 Tax=Neonectria ditissima TaxID=78410 RepID=A0A0P7BWT8_9HYPO|nr:hypothetical protein AK830_g230 [Neonectria ditissima]
MPRYTVNMRYISRANLVALIVGKWPEMSEATCRVVLMNDAWKYSAPTELTRREIM